MPPSALPNHLTSLVANRDTPESLVTDALEEWILHRRVKGDTLFEVSVGLAELESKVSSCMLSWSPRWTR